jgi:hypothetical protein
MGHDSKFKHKRSGDTDRPKKRHNHGDYEKGHNRKKKRKDEGSLRVVDDDVDDENMWVEKNIDMDGTKVCLFASFALSYLLCDE